MYNTRWYKTNQEQQLRIICLDLLLASFNTNIKEEEKGSLRLYSLLAKRQHSVKH